MAFSRAPTVPPKRGAPAWQMELADKRGNTKHAGCHRCGRKLFFHYDEAGSYAVNAFRFVYKSNTNTQTPELCMLCVGCLTTKLSKRAATVTDVALLLHTAATVQFDTTCGVLPPSLSATVTTEEEATVAPASPRPLSPDPVEHKYSLDVEKEMARANERK